jgi:hypothetical protein
MNWLILFMKKESKDKISKFIQKIKNKKDKIYLWVVNLIKINNK